MSRINPEKEAEPLHFSQAYGITIPDDDLDFFDLNLEYDTRLFIDPFLIKKSSHENERDLFENFGLFFKHAFERSLAIKQDMNAYNDLKILLNFSEPQEIGLGYTENSHSGAGPGPSFAELLFNFFIDNTAKRLISEDDLFPDRKFNPNVFEIFNDKFGPDHLSDTTANLIMDYLITYTQSQCKELGIPLKELPLNTDGFDFKEMEWKGGGHYSLPENLIKKGTAVILVPKRFLRALDEYDDHTKTKIKKILKMDSTLSNRFSNFLSKNNKEISIEDVRGVFLEEESIYKKYLEVLTAERINPYNFRLDFFDLLALKRVKEVFIKPPKGNSEIQDCDDLKNRTLELIEIFKENYSLSDGWKDMWVEKNGKSRPKTEPSIGRLFRASGRAYFRHFPDVTFESEVGTGNGSMDFKVIYKSCRIAIELKRLDNASPKGTPPLKSYLHGIQRQLPNYVKLGQCKHAIYLTVQHFTKINKPKGDDDLRKEEINNLVATTEEQMKKDISGFESLTYINISVTPHGTASEL